MNGSKSSTLACDDVITVTPFEVHPCGRCATFYNEHKQLLEHLYWRHGTESRTCTKCGLRRWLYATHVCHILPIEEMFVLEDCPSTRNDYLEAHCCGRLFEDVPMIGCDGPECKVQWYHFQCVGIVSPPEGDWFCPNCRGSDTIVLPVDSETRQHRNPVTKRKKITTKTS